MDSNIENFIEELKIRFKNQESQLDPVEIEKRLREFKTELYIKRDEVKKLRNDLESATLEINEHKKALNTLNRSNDENAFNNNILSKKYGSMMNELMEKRDSYMKLQMQHKMTVAENEILKEKLQENETEKCELARKVESFEAKQRHDFIYHKEILKQHSNSKVFMEEINDMVTKLKVDHAEAVELATKSKLAEEATEKLQFISKNYEKLKAEKDALEELYIKTNAKCETLEQLMSTRSEIHEPNLVTKLIYYYWKSDKAQFLEEKTEKSKILLQLTESYASEKTANIKLIYRNEELSDSIKDLVEAQAKIVGDLNRKIEDLKRQLNQFQGTETNENEVKNEPIEIQD
ncbi:unnamed protein product [Phaedon cochleariae]|uniref:Uncharacterized protein n=1 Tax=Phaedon cochleariae TaxID=80249 RepID=A0A9P0GPL5_PHACE|nr:unnamed protein product [Phaedon cochleariae]